MYDTEVSYESKLFGIDIEEGVLSGTCIWKILPFLSFLID